MRAWERTAFTRVESLSRLRSESCLTKNCTYFILMESINFANLYYCMAKNSSILLP